MLLSTDCGFRYGVSDNGILFTGQLNINTAFHQQEQACKMQLIHSTDRSGVWTLTQYHWGQTVYVNSTPALCSINTELGTRGIIRVNCFSASITHCQKMTHDVVLEFFLMTRCRVTRQKYVGNSQHVIGGGSPMGAPYPATPKPPPPLPTYNSG